MQLQNFIAHRDFNRPSLEILVDLIRLYCAYEVSLQHTRFRTPEVLDTRPDLLTDPNTFVPVDIDPAWDDKFPGSNGFAYYRLPIGLLNGETGLVVDFAGRQTPFRLYSALGAINHAAGTQLSTSDIEDAVVTNLSAPVVLVAKPGSLVWNNVPVPSFGPISLRDLAVWELPGLVYQQPL